MGISAISDANTVPVSVDLTAEELRLSVLRGLDKMYRVDKDVATGANFEMGEWAVLNGDGKLERPGASAVPNTYLVFCGTDRFDVHATGKATVIMNSPIIVKSSQFDPDPDYVVGMYLTVKSLGTGKAYVTEWDTGEPKLGRVTEVGSGYLVYETLNG